MEDVANKIVSKWKEIIESYSIHIESVECFRMSYYCYKVIFDFGLLDSNQDFWTTNKRVKLMKELELNFIDRFQPILVDKKIGTDYNSGETKFDNDRVDYFTNQGHRIIIQFYPQGFIDELRNDKLNELGII